jgi:hypothetical protein
MFERGNQWEELQKKKTRKTGIREIWKKSIKMKREKWETKRY